MGGAAAAAASPGRGCVLGVFLITLVVYALAATRVLTYAEPPTGDQPHYLMTVVSIVDDHDIDEFNNYNGSASYDQFYTVPDPAGFKVLQVDHPLEATRHVVVERTERGEAWYSKHGLGLPLLIVPGWVIGTALTPLLHGLTANGGGGWPGVAFELGLLGALLAVQVFLLAWDVTHRLPVALAVWAAVSFSNPQMSYSMLVFPEVPAALLTAYSFRRLALSWSNNTLWQLGLVGLCIGYLPWLNSRFLPIALGLMLLAVYQYRRGRLSSSDTPTETRVPLLLRLYGVQPCAALLAPVAVAVALLGCYYYRLHGSPLPDPTNYEGFFVPSSDERGHPVIGDWTALLLAILGLFLDQRWGLVPYTPVFLLAIVGASAMWQAPAKRPTLAWLGLIALPSFLVIADFRLWWGGWCPPARYLTTITPLLAVPLARSLLALQRVTLYKPLYAVLSAWGLAMMAGLLVGLQDRASDPLPPFYGFPFGQGSLFQWLAFRYHVNLVPLVPDIGPWFTDHQYPLPTTQIVVCLGMMGGMWLAGLVLLDSARARTVPAAEAAAGPRPSRQSETPPRALPAWPPLRNRDAGGQVNPKDIISRYWSRLPSGFEPRWRHTPDWNLWPEARHLLAALPGFARTAPWLWPYGGLGVVLWLTMWPGWVATRMLISGGDNVLAHYPLQVLLRDSLAAGEFPFWNPYTFGGVPAFATLHAGYAYPPTWAVVWAPAILGMNWIVCLHVLIAGLGAAWCAGRLGATKEGQFLSGVAYALGSAIIARMWAGHLSFVEGNAWLPLATGFAIGIGRRRAVVGLAISVALTALAGQPELLIFSLWWLPLWAVLSAVGGGRRNTARALLRAVLGVGLGIGLAAVQLLPTLNLVSVTLRPTGLGWDFLTGISLPPWHLLEAIAPTVFGDPRAGYWPNEAYLWHERLLYVGLVPLIAAALAVGRWRWICWGFAAAAIALSFGSYAPWYAWAMKILPGYGSFRVPPKHLVLAALALALAASIGIQRLQGRRVALAALGLALLIDVANLSFGDWFPAAAALLGGSDKLALPAVRSSLAGLAQPGLLAANFILLVVSLAALLPAPWAVRAQVALATLDLALVLGPYRINLSDPQPFVDLATPLRGHARAAWVGNGGAILANFGPVVQVAQPVGYNPLFSSGYATLVTGVTPPIVFDIDRADNPALYLLGYDFIVDSDKHMVSVVEPPPPQVWVARCLWPGTAVDVRQPSFPRQSCIASPAATVPEQPVPPGPAQLVSERSGRLQVEAEGPGWLVTNQPWYPGWSAAIAGQPAPVLVVDGALVGVQLPEGPNTVNLTYRPAGLDLGLLISIVIGLVLLVSWWWDRPGSPGAPGRPGVRDRSAPDLERRVPPESSSAESLPDEIRAPQPTPSPEASRPDRSTDRRRTTPRRGLAPGAERPREFVWRGRPRAKGL